jgi:hypothetical protein
MFDVARLVPTTASAVATVRVLTRSHAPRGNAVFDAPRGNAVFDAPRRLRPLDHQSVVAATVEVNVFLEDDISEQHQAILILEKPPRIEHDLNGLGPSEDGQPANDCAGREVGERGFSEPIAGASPGSWSWLEKTTRSVEDGIPTQERGNECESSASSPPVNRRLTGH